MSASEPTTPAIVWFQVAWETTHDGHRELGAQITVVEIARYGVRGDRLRRADNVLFEVLSFDGAVTSERRQYPSRESPSSTRPRAATRFEGGVVSA